MIQPMIDGQHVSPGSSLRRRAPLVGLLLFTCSFACLLSAQAKSEFERELEAGKQAALANKYTDAILHLNRANELQPGKCAECRVWLARVEMAQGKMDEALKDVDKAIAVARDSAQVSQAQLYRGVIWSRQGNLREAETAFKAASKANPDCLECRFNLGFVLLKESKNEEGVAVLKTVAPAFNGTPRGREIQRFIADPDRIRKHYAPEFSATSSTGEKINLDSLKGKVVLLDFWGTWCAPCRMSLPLLKDLSAKVDPARVAIISIDEYDPKPRWEQFIHDNEMNWSQVYDGDLSLHNTFDVDGFPRYVLLSKDGIILEEFKGWKQNGENTISDAVNRALQDPQ
jgi:thiol-disulfide isomerase/thioredoxin